MKILIYKCEDELAPIGGPSGYLYSIKQYRDKINDLDLFFKKDDWKFEKNIIDKIIARLRYSYSEQARNLFTVFHKRIDDREKDFNQYDMIHFHTTEEMYLERNNLKGYKGVVVLTSHSPKVAYKEIIEDIVPENEYLRYKTLFEQAAEFDEYAFQRADYIIFPCPGAEEPYYHSWPLYEKIRDEKKIRYVPTGIWPVECKKSREEIRKELNIPLDAVVLAFVGRHNEVKGYDLLQEIFAKLDNVYVVCCGRVGSIQPPKSERWIEVGWTTDPYSYVGASDIYMLPNRETYFDIAMLQTLSVGKCSVISNTGGNKEFVNTPGVKLYDSIDEAILQVKLISEMDIEKRKELEELQRREFFEKYSIDVFYKKYKATLIKLKKDEES